MVKLNDFQQFYLYYEFESTKINNLYLLQIKL